MFARKGRRSISTSRSPRSAAVKKLPIPRERVRTETQSHKSRNEMMVAGGKGTVRSRQMRLRHRWFQARFWCEKTTDDHSFEWIFVRIKKY